MTVDQLEVEFESTLRNSINEPLNLFLGAGFSLGAQDEDGHNLPLGRELRDELLGEFKLDAFSGLSLPQLCTIIESGQKDSLRRFLLKRFTVAKYDKSYQVVGNLPLSAVFKTNIDNLVPLIFEKSDSHYLNDITRNGPAFADKTAVDLVPLHGSVLHDRPFIFNPTDLAAAFSADRDMWHFLTSRLQKSPTIFWGYGVEDAGVLQALNPISSSGRDHKDKWILLASKDDAASTYFNALGFKIIYGTTNQFLAWLSANRRIGDPEVRQLRQGHNSVLHQYRIPTAAALPIRPLTDFYTGAAPSWSDVLSGRIYRTNHYSRVVESINSGRHVLVVGMFASGKTTLMMQVAAEHPFVGHKLVCSSLTLEKAILLGRSLQGEPALIFIDNMTDSTPAFRLLMKLPRVQVVGFERDVLYEQISHLVTAQQVKIIQVTDLSPLDVQGIVSSLPINLKKDALVRPRTEGGSSPSLFEVIEMNMRRPPISDRLTALLKVMERDAEERHDFLVMCAYVHSCRTPVSFDMAYAFLEEGIPSYEDVYRVIESLHSFVVDYVGGLIDAEEDYFVPRSSIVSNAIMKSVSSRSLRRVLLKFHAEISPYRIVQYDVFRRKGFDEGFATAAFPDPEEGKKYFEMLYARNNFPAVLQQGALYLMHKQRYQEAFQWIDQALAITGGRSPSIRNTHAIILFRANIGKTPSGSHEVREMLDRSMSILADCYRFDKRKNYHATVYGDQSVRYWKAYRDVQARLYLETAQKWLQEEVKRSPWHRRLGDILSLVDKALTRADRELPDDSDLSELDL